MCQDHLECHAAAMQAQHSSGFTRQEGIATLKEERGLEKEKVNPTPTLQHPI
jgi:hypothetical protein